MAPTYKGESVPKDIEGKLVDFAGRTYYKITGKTPGADDWDMEEYIPPDELTSRYGLPELNPDIHLVSSYIGDGMHLPAIDMDYKVVQVDYKNMLNPEQVMETMVGFQVPKRKCGVQSMLEAWRLIGVKEVTPQTIGSTIDWKVIFPAVSHPVHIVRSTANNHMYLNYPISWSAYRLFLEMLAEGGVISPYYCDFSIARQQSFLRYPGVTKVHFPSPASDGFDGQPPTTGQGVFGTHRFKPFSTSVRPQRNALVRSPLLYNEMPKGRMT